MDIKITEEVENLLKDNGLKKEEVMEIIDNAEASGHKLKAKEGDICIAKGVAENLTVYAVYNPSELVNVYTHKMSVLGVTGGEMKELEYDTTSDWTCVKCSEDAQERNVDMSYLDVTRPGPGIVCPNCGDVYVSEGVAHTLKTAESILEEKRA